MSSANVGRGAMFSHRQRVARMRHVAVRALDAYPLVDRELRFISDDENTTFRVDATGPDGRDRFLLRVHRPARHGRNIDSAAAIGSGRVAAGGDSCGRARW
jgi:hypothetical protein